MLLLHPMSLLNSLICNWFFKDSFGICSYIIISSSRRESFILFLLSFPNLIPLIIYLITLVNTYNTVLRVVETENNTVNGSGDSDFPDFSNLVSGASSKVRGWMPVFKLMGIDVYLCFILL